MSCWLTKCTQLLWLITTFWWENSLWKLTFTKKYLYLEALLNSVSFSQCIVLNDLHWDWVYHCFVLRRQETYNMKWLFSPLLDVRLHERITLWQKQTGLVTDTMICGCLSTYFMVPDCAHGQNKNITGDFCKATAWIKTTGGREQKPHSL